MSDVTTDFRRELESAGINPGEEIIADGQLHRCGTADKSGSKNGWYVLHGDNPASGAFGDWRTGEASTWTSKPDRDLSPAEREHLKARIAADRKAREAEEARRHADAADRAGSLLGAAEPATNDHPYLKRKGVDAHEGVKLAKDGRLVVSVLGPDGKVQSLQFIDSDGGKLFLSGGKTAGGYFAIKGADGPLYICEGYATGASVHAATGATVLVAFNCGNLKAVARMARNRYPERQIIICADDDHATQGNPGLTKATEAAKAISGLVAVPVFSDLAKRGTDFNDLHQAEGLEAVRRSIEAVPSVPPIWNGTVGQNAKSEAGQVLADENRGTSLGQDVGRGNQADSPAPLVCLTIGDILSMEIPKRGHVLYPAIPNQGLAMLYAPRGMGKTFAGLSVSYAVATGSAIWRFNAPEPRRVLYIDGEMPAGTIQERIAALVAGSDVQPDPQFLRIITPDVQAASMPNLASEAGQKAIAPYVQDADLIVIDNLATLARNGRENESESWTPVQRWLLELRRQGKSVLLVHHAGKGGNQRGTSAKEDVLDVVIALRRPEDYSPEQGARFEVHFEKARGVCGDAVKPFEAALVDNGRGLAWTVRELENVERDRVLALHKEGMTVREIAEETKISKSKVHRIVKEVGR